jgi:hypothetical protein
MIEWGVRKYKHRQSFQIVSILLGCKSGLSETSAAFALHGGDVTLQSFAQDACIKKSFGRYIDSREESCIT